MDYQFVILAAGRGTRMGQTDTPKVLVELKNRPIIFYLLEELKKSQTVKKPVVVVGFKHVQVKQLLGNDYIYAFQRDQLGTGHAVWSAEKQATAKDIVVLYGDMPFIKWSSLAQLVRLHENKKSKITMFTTHAPNFEGHFASLDNYGRILRDSFGNIVKITEYKDASLEERAIKEVNPGIYMFNSAWLWDNIHYIQNQNTNKEYYLTDIVEIAITSGEQVHSHVINPKEVLGINTVEQLQAAARFV
jgi:bifunctional N-acetylglucosamine-1-phosphate-uridyltransferase/glucosamine-1-phosphate-acetyltransferase GlmU-like protein